jgi:hypothetical protein
VLVTVRAVRSWGWRSAVIQQRRLRSAQRDAAVGNQLRGLVPERGRRVVASLRQLEVAGPCIAAALAAPVQASHLEGGMMCTALKHLDRERQEAARGGAAPDAEERCDHQVELRWGQPCCELEAHRRWREEAGALVVSTRDDVERGRTVEEIVRDARDVRLGGWQDADRVSAMSAAPAEGPDTESGIQAVTDADGHWMAYRDPLVEPAITAVDDGQGSLLEDTGQQQGGRTGESLETEVERRPELRGSPDDPAEFERETALSVDELAHRGDELVAELEQLERAAAEGDREAEARIAHVSDELGWVGEIGEMLDADTASRGKGA